jgi:hypothetical protein
VLDQSRSCGGQFFTFYDWCGDAVRTPVTILSSHLEAAPTPHQEAPTRSPCSEPASPPEPRGPAQLRMYPRRPRRTAMITHCNRLQESARNQTGTDSRLTSKAR